MLVVQSVYLSWWWVRGLVVEARRANRKRGGEMGQHDQNTTFPYTIQILNLQYRIEGEDPMKASFNRPVLPKERGQALQVVLRGTTINPHLALSSWSPDGLTVTTGTPQIL